MGRFASIVCTLAFVSSRRSPDLPLYRPRASRRKARRAVGRDLGKRLHEDQDRRSPIRRPSLSSRRRRARSGRPSATISTYSGYFEILDPALYPLAATSPEQQLSDKWASIGAAAVAVGKLNVASGRVDLRTRLLNTTPATTLFDRRYGSPVGPRAAGGAPGRRTTSCSS